MPKVILAEEDFEQEVLRTEKTVLPGFWASWCSPRRMVASAIEETAKKRTDIVAGTVIGDKQPELAERHQIVAIPAWMALEMGRP